MEIKLLTTVEAAKLLNISPQTLRNDAKKESPEIPRIRVLGRYMYKIEDIEKILGMVLKNI